MKRTKEGEGVKKKKKDLGKERGREMVRETEREREGGMGGRKDREKGKEGPPKIGEVYEKNR